MTLGCAGQCSNHFTTSARVGCAHSKLQSSAKPWPTMQPCSLLLPRAHTETHPRSALCQAGRWGSQWSRLELSRHVLSISQKAELVATLSPYLSNQCLVSGEAMATRLAWKEVSVTEKSWRAGERRGGGGGELAETPVDKRRGQDWERANKVWLGLGVSGLLVVSPSRGSTLWFGGPPGSVSLMASLRTRKTHWGCGGVARRQRKSGGEEACA